MCARVVPRLLLSRRSAPLGVRSGVSLASRPRVGVLAAPCCVPAGGVEVLQDHHDAVMLATWRARAVHSGTTVPVGGVAAMMRSSVVGVDGDMLRAKGKKRGKKARRKGKAAAVESDDEDEDEAGDDVEEEEVDLEVVRDAMTGHLNWLVREFGKLRVGAASPAMLDGVMVHAYGDTVPLPQLAQVAAISPHLLTCTVFDVDVAGNVGDAIRDAGLNLNPQVDGTKVKVPIPKTTKETREKTAKVAQKLAEETKLAIRHGRKKALDMVKSQKGISEDDSFRMQKEVQTITDDFTARVQELLDAKVDEVTTA